MTTTITNVYSHLRQTETNEWRVMKTFEALEGEFRVASGKIMKASKVPLPLPWTEIGGKDKFVNFTITRNDNSTGSIPVIRTDTGPVVSPDNSEVTRTITIRDMTQAELDARTDEEIQAASDGMDKRRELIALATAIWHVKKGTEPADAFDSQAKYKAWLRSLLS